MDTGTTKSLIKIGRLVSESDPKRISVSSIYCDSGPEDDVSDPPCPNPERQTSGLSVKEIRKQLGLKDGEKLDPSKLLIQLKHPGDLPQFENVQLAIKRGNNLVFITEAN